eukprot:CAMPEP_0180699678 /NCGR_PEP_ID=MMETSP1038_2-20121128/4676_1 /TAXON_ID=632150 /ORGANISM="Azadinium spinosum, Strain 3D9" /LENGTH=44 /DNA_ID= /DNA_START= /DNA_END= /DNA_ORIENTATION=
MTPKVEITRAHSICGCRHLDVESPSALRKYSLRLPLVLPTAGEG